VKLARVARVDPLAAKLDAIDRKLDLLLSRLSPGQRDQGDEVLVGVIASCSQGHAFTAAALWRRRSAGDVVLADAFASADIENPQQLGKLLKRNEGRTVNGVSIDRVGLNREGVVWQARVQE
jgi:hypothetical protein